ncbi:putative chemotaxis protein cheC, inhibitor of mcp methylation [Candidatus Nitrososphaera gargensis Ga9.2]|uniref:Putative chemotaxis protein cheC, inhibitor of mcp methylation n=1 Tax=Nitrososphaera gargensis (strain Ga9.2) TaxID=1237085 RepID=K0IMK1_NITGG|nr:chemotaxis protein cheC, inhibitor of mcp methylation [Candidatus Nitrososphaera gargensis]AFU57959.1 putative chemotaxis protein cheC, inhibitor of mcp methylation [Candidatus Nitrososphaera gargensis Ga9.2]
MIVKNNHVSISEAEITDLGTTISMLASGTSKSLAMMTGEEYTYSFGRINEVKPQYVDQLVQLFNEELCAVYLRADGDVTVGMMLFLTHEQARQLARRLLGNNDLKELDILGRSSISEVGNILFAGSFLNDMAKYTGFKMKCSVPGFATDTIHGIIEFPISDIAATDNILVIAESELVGKITGTRIKVLIIMGITDARKLAASTGTPKRKSE